MFTTHTESTANFWNVGLAEIEKYNKMFEDAIKEELESFKPDVIHAQHNWLTSSICNNFQKPVVLTIHGTDLMGYKKAGEKLEEIKERLSQIKENMDTKSLANINNVEEIYKKAKTKAEIMRELKNAIQTKKIDISKKALGNLIDIYDKKKLYELYRHEAEKSAKQSERIIVISDAQEHDFNGLFPGNEKRVSLLENGYDAKVFYQKQGINRKETLSNLIGEENSNCDNVALFVGKFADFKGIDALLDAARIYETQAEQKNKSIETIIVGSGVLDETLRAQAKTLGLQHTHFVGRKNHSEICDLQNIADVSLIPSRNEPFGLVVIEGTATGHPVIATNSGGIPGILNVNNEDFSDSNKTYTTKLGVLVPPLPERPNQLDDEAKKELDKMTTQYSMLENKEEKESFVKEMSELLGLDENTILEYLSQYMNTVNGISKSVMDICERNLEFDNTEIAQYTKETYSQEVIRDRIMGIFEEAEAEHKRDLSL